MTKRFLATHITIRFSAEVRSYPVSIITLRVASAEGSDPFAPLSPFRRGMKMELESFDISPFDSEIPATETIDGEIVITLPENPGDPTTARIAVCSPAH